MARSAANCSLDDTFYSSFGDLGASNGTYGESGAFSFDGVQACDAQSCSVILRGVLFSWLAVSLDR